jgi:hypothetical protein
MFGDAGLAADTSRITLNGFRTTVSGNNSTFRIRLVTGSGKLTLRGLTITGGNAPGPGGGIFNLEGTLAQDHSRVTGRSSLEHPQRPVHHVGPLSRKSRAARGLGIRLGAPLWAIRNEVDPRDSHGSLMVSRAALMVLGLAPGGADLV